jgi:hypothetical protein
LYVSKLGFVELEELPELWGADNPCLYMIREIRGRYEWNWSPNA